MGMLEVNDAQLFVDDRGPSDGIPLLYVHGGPGQGCWDFMASVGDRLAEHGIRVIGVDQRGALRSVSLPDGAPLSVPILLADFEAIRLHFGLASWFVLGHSAGGGYALDYAIAHPDAIRGVVFDCPSWDADATDRYRLPVAADRLDAAGRHAAATVCRSTAAAPGRLEFDTEVMAAMQQLGPDYMRLFTFDGTTLARCRALERTEPDELDWARGMSHMALVPDMYRDRTGELRDLRPPSMVIHGIADLVTPPSVIDRYRRDTTGSVVSLERAGHFAFIEQPDEYVVNVARFIERSTNAVTGL